MTQETLDAFVGDIARDVVVVAGPDATSFLQSLVSADLDPVAVGTYVHSLLLQPQGKLIVDFYAWRVDPDTWWCICEGGFGAALAEGLRRFKIRVKVEIEEKPVCAVVVRGAEVLGIATNLGTEVVGVVDDIASLKASLDLPELDAVAVERLRIEAGIPRLGADIDERTIPQEAFLERDAVSFTKGCFVGQELVCRIDTRGHVNRYLRRLRGSNLTVGAALTVGDKQVGEITSSAGDVALGMVRREIDPGATLTVGATTATVEQL